MAFTIFIAFPSRFILLHELYYFKINSNQIFTTKYIVSYFFCCYELNLKHIWSTDLAYLSTHQFEIFSHTFIQVFKLNFQLNIKNCKKGAKKNTDKKNEKNIFHDLIKNVQLSGVF